jgi:hypothetical protein
MKVMDDPGNKVIRPAAIQWGKLLVAVGVVFVVIMCLNNQPSSPDSSTHEESEFLSYLIGERGTLAIFRRDGDQFRQSEILRNNFDSFVVGSIPVSTFQTENWASKYLAEASGVVLLVQLGSANESFAYSMKSWPIIEGKIYFGGRGEVTDIENLRASVSRTRTNQASIR